MTPTATRPSVLSRVCRTSFRVRVNTSARSRKTPPPPERWILWERAPAAIGLGLDSSTAEPPPTKSTSQPANQPTSQPANQPTSQPATHPTGQPAPPPYRQPPNPTATHT